MRWILQFIATIFVATKVVESAGTPKFVFPPTSPTRHQLISGIGVPLQLIDESITYGWTMKAQYFLPETINILKFEYFKDIFPNYTQEFLFDQVWHRFPNGRRRREIAIDPSTGQKFERYESIVEEISNEPLNEDADDEFDDEFEEDKVERRLLAELKKQKTEAPWSESETHPDLSSSRWSIYEALATTLERNKMNGRVCLLRAICETSRTEFHRDYLAGELFHIFFTPSTTAESEPVTKASDYDYIKAEQMGRDDGDGEEQVCEKAFHDCHHSIMDVFTQIFDAVV